MPSISQNPRAWIIRFLFIGIALIIIARLFALQVVEDKYKIMANDQAIYRKIVYPARGAFLDRHGKPLMINHITYDLTVTPSKITKEMDTATFCTIMNISREDFAKSIKKITVKYGATKPGIYTTQLSDEQNAGMQENLYLFPGFELVERTTRSYPKPIGAAIFGYTAEISAKMLQQPRYTSYQQGDYVGITGLESVYEEVLRGQRGVEYMVRDVHNVPRDHYKNGELDTPAVSGKALQLYLDADLQAYAEKLMEGKIGSAVAIDPKTGGILAMVSAPSYDPNLLTGKDRSKNIGKLFADHTTPMVNRAIQAVYPPGSTFKPLTALIALDVGAITPKYGYPCRGGYYACGRPIGCTEKWAGHASDLRMALAYSCNSYFCNVFRMTVDDKNVFPNMKIGLQKWHDYLYSFGLGHPLGVDITGEKGGNIPDSTYFNGKYGPRGWNSCTMVFVGMGQGELEITPMQMANTMCMIANNGYFYTPHFVKSVAGNENDPLLKKYHQKHVVTHIPNDYFEVVKEGMEDVVLKGTGRVAQLPGVEVCGKTGTVENYAMIHGKKTKLDNHSVFVCFAPKNDPKIAIAVVVQNSGYGATWAGPVASLMMEKYLIDTVKRDALQDRIENAKLIKPYIYILDSAQRAKDRMRELLRTADSRYRDSVKRERDTALVRQILNDYYQLHIPIGTKPDSIEIQSE